MLIDYHLPLLIKPLKFLRLWMGSDSDAILPRKGLVTRAMSKRLQEDWARAAEEGPRILMNLRGRFLSPWANVGVIP